MLTSLVEVLQGGFDVENPPSSKRAVAVGSHNGQPPVCDGMGVDGKWEHHRVHQVTRGCESVRARRLPLLLLTTIVAEDIL